MTTQALKQQPAISATLAAAWQQFEDARERYRADESRDAAKLFEAAAQEVAERGLRCSPVRRVEERLDGERAARLLHLSVNVAH
jgi:hypothetical protein